MDGSEYCVLHEPFEGKSEEEKIKLTELKRETFLKEVSEGESDFSGIVLENSRFENLLLVNLNFKKVKMKNVEFKNCKFMGKLWFEVNENKSRTIFDRTVLFSFCLFHGDLAFLGVDFRSSARFILCTFMKRVLFIGYAIGYERPNRIDLVYSQIGINNCEKYNLIELEFYYCIFSDILDFSIKIGENVEVNFAYTCFDKPDKIMFRDVNLSKASFLYVRGIEKAKFVNVRWNKLCMFENIK